MWSEESNKRRAVPRRDAGAAAGGLKLPPRIDREGNGMAGTITPSRIPDPATERGRGAAVRVSAVILSFNSARYIEACIRSLAAALAPAADRDEIWVVENGSTDGSVAILQRLEQEFAELRVIYCAHNTGTTVSRNLALRRARGRYIMIIDSDVEVEAGTIDALIAVLDREPRCGIAAPRLVFPDGRPQLSTDAFPTIGRKLQRFVALRRIESAVKPPARDELRRVDYAISAFWAMRREMLDRVGYFDERIFYSPEDVDYCLRVWQAGYAVLHVGAAEAVHDGQEVSRRFARPLFMLRHVKGLLYLFCKHRYGFGLHGIHHRLGLASREPRHGSVG
jgi:GT2 family glycosyltransferase